MLLPSYQLSFIMYEILRKFHFLYCNINWEFYLLKLCGKESYIQSWPKISSFLAILSENATLLSENCSNCKCFGIHLLIVFVCTATTQKNREEKSNLIKFHRTQKWTGQNDWHLVKIVRNNCFSSMWCSCNLYLDTPVASNRCGQYSNHTCNQLKWGKVDSTFLLSMEKRKKCKELSVDLREKIVEKHGQSQGYKSISRDLNVPVSTVRNIIKRFTAHATVANLPGRGRKSKINEKLQRSIVRMVDKEPRLTTKQIQADLQTQGTTVSARTIHRHLNEKGRYGRRPRRTPLLTQRHKKARLEFAKTYVTKPQSFWENVLWTDETKVELFGKGHHGTVYRKRNEAFK